MHNGVEQSTYYSTVTILIYSSTTAPPPPPPPPPPKVRGAQRLLRNHFQSGGIILRQRGESISQKGGGGGGINYTMAKAPCRHICTRSQMLLFTILMHHTCSEHYRAPLGFLQYNMTHVPTHASDVVLGEFSDVARLLSQTHKPSSAVRVLLPPVGHTRHMAPGEGRK